MATYTSDLTARVLSACDAVTGWSELPSPHASGAAPSSETENYFHNANSVSQATGQATGQGAGIQYDNAAAVTWTTSSNWCFFAWTFYAAPTNLLSWANGGMRIGIGSADNNAEMFNIGGNDFGTYPYGGWQNSCFDPEGTSDQTIGSPTAGSYQNFAVLPNITAKITKGSPLAVDIVRYGRGQLLSTGADCTFSGMATFNDNETTGRYGLFALQSGSYLWKGLMSFGDATTSCTFSDSNKLIRVEDTARVLAGFNKIEVTHASSSVTWTNITLQGVQTSITGSAPVSPGDYETVTANATVTFAGCTFADLGTFLFRTGTSASNTVFRRCGQIDVTNGGTLTGGTVSESEITSTQGAVVTSSLANISGTRFERGTTGHAVELDTPGSYTWTGTADTAATPTGIEYRTGVTGSPISPTNNGDELIYITTNGTYNINVSTGTTPSIRLASGVTATVNVTGGGVTIDVNVKNNANPPVAISGAYVYIDEDLDTAGEIANVTTNASGDIAQQSYSGGASSATLRVRKYGYKPFVGTISLLSNSSTNVNMVPDPQQT